MKNHLQAASLIVVWALISVGCAGRPEDGVIKTETVLNSATGVVDMPHVEGYVTTDNTGMQLWYDIFGAADDPTVLLIHGSDAQAVAWMPHFYEPLVSGGFRVIRFDQRDNGLSESFGMPKGFKPNEWTPEQEAPYPLVDMAEDAIGLLERLDVDHAHVIGHSMGGMIAQIVALRRPDLVTTLTLMSTSPSHSFDPTLQPPEVFDLFENELGGMLRAMALPSFFMPLTRNRMMKGTKEFFSAMDDDTRTVDGERALDAWISTYYADGRKLNLMSWQGMAIVTSSSRVSELPSLTIPTLVVHGDRDKLIDYRNAQALADIVPNARLVTLGGGGHLFPLFESYRDQYLDAVLDHLATG